MACYRVIADVASTPRCDAKACGTVAVSERLRALMQQRLRQDAAVTYSDGDGLPDIGATIMRVVT